MVKKRSGGSLIGSWAFLIGVVLAIVIGLFGSINQILVVVLVLAGLLVGLFNVGAKETTPFLLAGTVLVIVSSFGKDVVSIVPVLDSTLQALLTLFVPATIVVAIKHVFSLSRN